MVLRSKRPVVRIHSGVPTFRNPTAMSTVLSSYDSGNFRPRSTSELLKKSSSKSRNRRVVPLALTITGLSKTYPNGVKALKNLSLTIGNLMFGLLGPNGAGKSSLMRTVATLQDPDSGSIDLDGLNGHRRQVDDPGDFFRDLRRM